MARPEISIDPSTGPEAAFAVELRQLRELAGLTYRELAQHAYCSYGALCEAARGRDLPTWQVTQAFVKGCAGDEQQWLARWEAAATEVKRNSGMATAPGGGGGEGAASSKSSDAKKRLPSGNVPPLSSITSPQDFHLALRELRTRTGNPSLRDLNVLARKHGDHVLPRSTLADVLVRTDRLPSLDIVEAFLSACGVQVAEVDAWKAAWTRVAYLLQRDSMPGSARWQDGCPYLGLAAFNENQAEIFYGRELMTTHLLAQLANRVRGGVSMLVVTGPSGAGKSSLLRAGLLPALAKASLGPGSQDWPHLVITPGSAPLDELARHLAKLAGANSAEVRESLAEHPETAHLTVRQALADAAQHAGSELGISPSRLVLVVDQFEELFTVVSDKAERGAFITSLCAMAGVGHTTAELPPAIVVLGLRADSLSDCTTYTPLAEAVRSSVFLVGPMTEVELRSAITGPAAAAGLSIEAGLVDKVLVELRSTRTPGGFDSGALPLLSQAMLLTWEHREGTTLTHRAYAAGGGLHNGIETSANIAYGNLTPPQQEAARGMFLRMVTLTDHGQPTRRRVQSNDLSATDDVSAALQEFTNKRLVTLGKDTAEIVHEVLLHTWQQLRSWIDQDRESLRLRRELESAASMWEENERDPAFLYRGSRLTSVQENLNDTNSPVPPSAQSFLDSSRNHERRRTRKQHGLRTLVGLLVVVVLFIGFGIYHRRAISDTTTGDNLANGSQPSAVKRPEASMLLAVEASHRATTMTTTNALLRAQSQYFVGDLTGHTKTINKVVFSSLGTTLATASADGTARLWDVASNRQIGTLSSRGEVEDVEFSPDGRLLVTAGVKDGVQLWDVANQQLVATLSSDSVSASSLPASASAAKFSYDGRLVAGATTGGTKLWNVDTHESIATFPGSNKKIEFSHDRTTLATISVYGVVQLWDVINPHSPTPLGSALRVTDPTGVHSVVFSPDGRTLATVDENGTVHLWNIGNPRQPGPPIDLSDHRTHVDVDSIAFSPDGSTLITGGDDGTAQLWNAFTGKSVGTLRGHDGAIRSVAFRPDGHIVATAGNDHIVRLWETDGPILSSPTISDGVEHMEFSHDGYILATFGQVHGPVLWDTVSKTKIGPLIDEKDEEDSAVAFSEDGHLLATGDAHGAIRLWNMASQRKIIKFSDRAGSIDNIDKVVFSPDNRILAAIGDEKAKIVSSVHQTELNPVLIPPGQQDKIIQLWNVADPSKPTFMNTLRVGHIENTNTAVVFNRNGHILATVGTDGAAGLWDVVGGGPIRKLTDGISLITGVLFSPDGDSLTTFNSHGTIQRWDEATGGFGAPRTVPGENSTFLAFSPNSHILVTKNNGDQKSDDTTLKLWKTDGDGAFILMATLTGGIGNISTAVFSRDGSHLATADQNDTGTVRLWDLDIHRVATHLCHIVGSMDEEQWKNIMVGFSYDPTCRS